MPAQSRTAEQAIGRIADGQRGLATREQLLGVGVSRAQIARRIDRGQLRVEFPGVYRVGHAAPSLEASYLAAVLACGEGDALSGAAASYLYWLVKGKPPPPEVTTRSERRIEGVKTKRCRELDPRDVTRFRGIPVTTVPRTLADLAASLSPRALSLACHEAGVRYRTTPAEVSEVLARRPNTPGSAKLRRVIQGDEPVSLSRLESRFLTLLAEHGLPLPITNKPAGGRRVDCRWPAHARGDQFRRYTWDDVDRPAAVLRELRGLLDAQPESS